MIYLISNTIATYIKKVKLFTYDHKKETFDKNRVRKRCNIRENNIILAFLTYTPFSTFIRKICNQYNQK